MKKFEYLEHTADIKFRAFGNSIEEVFSNSSLAMFNSMFEGEVKETISKKIKVCGDDNESLLYNFLEELLFLLDSSNFFLSKIKSIKICGKVLIAEVGGDLVKNYETSIDVKAITYNDMFVREEKGKWISQVVLDV